MLKVQEVQILLQDKKVMRGQPCFICGKQMQLNDQILLSLSLQQNEQQTTLDINLKIQNVNGQYVICQLTREEDQEELAQNLINGDYESFFTVTLAEEINQPAQFTQQPGKFYSQIYKGYNKFESKPEVSAEIKLVQSDDWYNKIKTSLDIALKMEKCQDPRYSPKQNEQQQFNPIFNQEQLQQRQLLIQQLLYGTFNNKLQQVTYDNESIIEVGKQLRCNFTTQQIKAIKQSLEQVVTCINGFPFSGKSTIASAIAVLAQQQKQNQQPKQILIQVKQNKCADQICQILSKVYKPGEIIRVYSHTQQQIMNSIQQKDELSEFVSKYTLQDLIINEMSQQDQQFAYEVKLYMYSKEIFKQDSTADEHRVKNFIKQQTKQLLSQAKIIITTVLTAYDDRLEQQYFDTVIVDDGHNLNFGETILCASKAISRFVLIGDIQQQQTLGRNQGIYQTGYFNSFIRRIQNRNNSQYLQITNSFKQNSSIVDLLNKEFYHGQILLSGIYDAITVPSLKNVAEQKLNQPLALVNNLSDLRYDDKSKTYYNLVEAQTVKKVINQLISMDVNEQDITIITNQLAQELKIKEALTDYQNIQVCSTNTLSGLQTPILIYSFCFTGNQFIDQSSQQEQKQNQDNYLNLFKKRNNKAVIKSLLSRSKQQIILVGDKEFIQQTDYLKSIINYFVNFGIQIESDKL